MIIEDIINRAAANWYKTLLPGDNFFFLYILSAIAMAGLSYLWFAYRGSASRPEAYNKSFLRYVFDGEVWLHPSAKQDYLFIILNSVVYYGIVAHFLISSEPVFEMFMRFLERSFGSTEGPVFEVTYLTGVLYTIAAITVIDFVIFITHYIQHKFAPLWHFHAVHHSAEVLTIFTVTRQHPVDLFFTSTIMILLSQFTFALFTYLTHAEPSEVTIWNVNVILFTFFLFGYNLRHSHIWLSYPKWLSYIFISPAQHQTHHSVEVKHFDKNFGFILAVWDWMFGTLYVPDGYEKLEFGISRQEPNPYPSLFTLYAKPFKRSWQEIRKIFD